MLSLAEYRHTADRLADHLPWAALVAEGVVLNKDGSFQRTFAFRGPDLESATEAELISASARANNVLKRFGSGWALFFEAERRPALGYPDSSFPDVASWLVDRERRRRFEAEGAHYESRYHLTLAWLPAPDGADAAGRTLVDRPDATSGRDWRGALASFVAETDRALDLMAAFMPEIRALSSAETLTYLHGTISTRRHSIAVPETPMYLDALLVDTPLVGGLEPMLGSRHLRTLTVTGFPTTSRPGILDALNEADFPYRWTTRFIALDKSDATKLLTKIRRQWFNKRKSIAALLREVLYNQPTQLLDTDADNKVADADLALQALGGDHVAFGYLTTTITVSDEDRARVEDKIRHVERITGGLGFATIREGVNAVEAWLSSLPGHAYANVRQPIVHTLNLAHLMPLSSVWAGPTRNAHLDGPPLIVAQTAGSTPFRLSTHVGDVGHMMVVGPTGAGKSVLLALIALQFRRYAGARIYIFDKGLSARAAVLAMGGAHHSLGAGNAGDALAFQPLQRIDDPAERSWAAEWVAALLGAEKVAITPEIKDAVWSALNSLASAPPQERTMTGLALLTDVALQPGETLGAVATGDTVRWVIGDATSGSGDAKRTHVLVKPFMAGLTTNVVITTDRRTYHLALTSTGRTAMSALSWTYPQDQLIAFRAAAEQARAAQPVASGLSVEQLHFDYTISGDQPAWRPLRAFDDGRQTFIEFPPSLGVGEAPPLFLVDGKGTASLVNYRVRGRYYVVDRLFDAAELRLGLKHQDVVRISRTGEPTNGRRPA